MKKNIFMYGLMGFVLLTGCRNEKSLSLGLMADCQYCDCPTAGTRNYKGSLAKLKQAVDMYETLQPDMLFHIGDIIDKDFSSYDKVLPIINSSSIPVYHALGNHDFSVDSARKEEVYRRLQVGIGYYTIEKNGWKCIVLNGNDLSLYAAKDEKTKKEAQRKYEELKEMGKVNAHSWNGGIGTEQQKWLIEELQKAESEKTKVIIMCHFPVYPHEVHGLWEDEKMVALISQYSCVKAWFAGHNHAGNYVEHNGIHFITLHGMVEENTNAYAHLTLSQDSLILKGYGRQPDYSLPVLGRE